ncbi:MULTISPECIES: hypothetical protein [unclassified Streptomyces]|uniref:hypothetical protein n=1 Tax=unclassified Streptomyces TaxID=2593676 RepID=UPI00202FDB18|nr:MULTISPECIES: hypothetical protein [unclassified Streptomyces]MCM1964966.1 hypothetical protein [Streptomyces sp. G1]MCX5124793.1 hypothetical protein [Streptomyces sp. NBC_00347]
MKKVWRVAGVAAGAAAGVMLMSGPAMASEYHNSADVPGAWGTIDFDYRSSTRADPIYLWVKDTREDGRVARMRVVAGTGGGTKYYSWRTASGMYNTTEATTYLYDSTGIVWISIEVCRASNAGNEVCAYSTRIWNNYV